MSANWSCSKCREVLEESFDACWRCGTAREGVDDPGIEVDAPEGEPSDDASELGLEFLATTPRGFFEPLIPSSGVHPSESINDPDESVDRDDHEARDTDPIVCSRCYLRLDYVGTNRFQGEDRVGLRAILVNMEGFDIYACPRCGKIELFAIGIGDRFRSTYDPGAEQG